MNGLLLLLCAVQTAGPDVRLTAKGPGGLTGQADLTARLLPETGGKYVRLSMKLRYENGRSVDVLTESTYDRLGAPVRMLQSTVIDGQRTAVTAVFDAKGATLMRSATPGKDRRVDLPEGATAAAPHEFWFFRDRPAPGTKATFWQFSLGDAKWVETPVVYEGPRALVIGTKQVRGHAVKVGSATAFLDDRGLPHRLEAGSVVLERSSE